MTSRRRKQAARRTQRILGGSYAAALGRTQQGRVTGWPGAHHNLAETRAIHAARTLKGNSLPADAIASVCSLIGIEPGDEPDEVMVAVVGPLPAHAPRVESCVIHQYEYGLDLEEVIVDFTADLEFTVPDVVAREILRRRGTVTDHPEVGWTTVALTHVRLRLTASVRVDWETAEVVDKAVRAIA